MKTKILALALILGIGFLGCSNDDSNYSTQEELINGTWNLKNLSGGFAGIDEDYETGSIIWTFDSQNQTIIIVNNNQESTSYIFESGTYNYSLLEINNESYIEINNEEYGGITFSANNLIIDQNKISDGTGADGFILHFEK